MEIGRENGRMAMENAVESLIESFEEGHMTRRELAKRIAGMAALAAGVSGSAAAQESSTFTATGLNHIALNVPDIEKSRDFYVKHLGMTVSRQGSTNCFMTCGPHFVALFKHSNPSMNHYCYSVEGYDVNDAAEKLKAQGITPRVTGQRIYFPDPDGLEVQLAAGDHRP
jgi:catechol-2,3-dioxygenase